MEKRNRSCKQGHTMKQTKGTLCKRKSGVARCQAQHQCHFLANKFDVLGSYQSYLCIS